MQAHLFPFLKLFAKLLPPLSQVWCLDQTLRFSLAVMLSLRLDAAASGSPSASDAAASTFSWRLISRNCFTNSFCEVWHFSMYVFSLWMMQILLLLLAKLSFANYLFSEGVCLFAKASLVPWPLQKGMQAIRRTGL